MLTEYGILTNPPKGTEPLFRWTLRSPARLHFGLVEICPDQPHLFGGLGVTIDQPETSLVAEAHTGKFCDISHYEIENAGSWLPRIETVLEKFNQTFVQDHASPSTSIFSEKQAVNLRLVKPPEAHAGLGSGTQIACSMATLLAAIRLESIHKQCIQSAFEVWEQATFPDNLSILKRLADITGRGKRSYVGLAGHLYGGLIVDHGVHEINGGERTITRIAIPDGWHALLAYSQKLATISGKQELDYFTYCAKPNLKRNQMLSLIVDEIIPAIENAEMDRFGNALFEYGRLGGEIFQAVQSGLYRDSEVTALIEAIRQFGILATGQTSWGPTVYAIVPTWSDADHLQRKLQTKFGSMLITKICRLTNQPASVSFFRSD